VSDAWEQDFKPEVVLIFGTGSRKGQDFIDCGPGLYYALALHIAFIKLGYPICSRMLFEQTMWNHKSPDSQLIDKLTAKDGKIRLVIVIRNEDLYRDTKALRQIAVAQQQKVPHLYPLTFSTKIPELKDQWQNINWLNDTMVKDRKAVQGFFEKLQSIPPPPQTVQQDQQSLDIVCNFVKKVVDLERQKEADAIAKVKADELAKKQAEEDARLKAEEDERMAPILAAEKAAREAEEQAAVAEMLGRDDASEVPRGLPDVEQARGMQAHEEDPQPHSDYLQNLALSATNGDDEEPTVILFGDQQDDPAQAPDAVPADVAVSTAQPTATTPGQNVAGDEDEGSP